LNYDSSASTPQIGVDDVKHDNFTTGLRAPDARLRLLTATLASAKNLVVNVFCQAVKAG
jgi:hypothetical protein